MLPRLVTSDRGDFTLRETAILVDDCGLLVQNLEEGDFDLEDGRQGLSERYHAGPPPHPSVAPKFKLNNSTCS